MLQKHILPSVVASVALMTAAHAADLGMQPPPPLAPVPVFTWSGFYVGVNAGARFSGSNKSNLTYVDPLEGPPPSNTNFGLGSGNKSSFVGGPEVGFNWQVNSWVFGLEGDWNFASRTNRHGFFAKENCELTACAFGPDGFDHFLSTAGGTGDFGTLRGRLGWAIDHTLLYVTGGLAFGDSNGKTTVKDYRLLPGSTQLASYAGVPVDTFYDNNSNTELGYTVGAGLEYAIDQSWSIKAEYLYVSLDGGGGSQLLEGSGPDFGPNPGNIGTLTVHNKRDSFSVVRVGLNFKFGGYSTPAPVVAAY